MNERKRMKKSVCVCVYEREREREREREKMNIKENENQGVASSYVDWDLIPFPTCLNSSEKLTTQEVMRVTGFLMGNSEGTGAVKSQNQVVMQCTRKCLLKGRCKTASEI